MKKERVLSWVIFILLAVVWGTSFILMKKSAEHLTGWQIGAIRISSAGLFFLPFAVFHLKKLPSEKLLIVLLSGVLGNLIPAFLFAIAIQKRIDSSLAGILNSLTPFFVIVIGTLFFKQTIQSKKIVGVIIGFIGLLLLNLTRGPININDFGFTLMILLGTVLYGTNVNLIGKYLKGIDAFKVATVSLAFIAIPTTIFLWQQDLLIYIQENPASHISVIMACILGVVSTAICTALFYGLIKRAGGLFASLVTYAIPIVAILWGIWDQEDIGLLEISCLGVILSGVYLANK